MRIEYKILSIVSIGLISLTTGCIVNPGNNRSNDSYKSNYDSSDRYNRSDSRDSSRSAQVYDLIGKDTNYAWDRLESRGFRQKGGMTHMDDYNLTWWYNSDTDQCFEMRTSDHKAKLLSKKPTSDCRHAPGDKDLRSHRGDNNEDGSFSDIPKRAKKACRERFGVDNVDHIKTVSPLKPGWWEIIIKGKGGRQVACTVNESGSISNWVKM